MLVVGLDRGQEPLDLALGERAAPAALVLLALGQPVHVPHRAAADQAHARAPAEHRSHSGDVVVRGAISGAFCDKPAPGTALGRLAAARSPARAGPGGRGPGSRGRSEVHGRRARGEVLEVAVGELAER